MIRVNLLGDAKPKARGPSLAASAWAMLGGLNSPMLKVLLVLGLTAAANLAWFRRLENEKQAVVRQVAAVEQRGRAVAQVKPRYLERQKQTESCKRRLAVIEGLRARRPGPAELLMVIADTVNRTDAVWLNHVKDNDSTVDLEGMALQPDAVANLMTNLAKTGYFQKVELKESVQDDTLKDTPAFLFTLTCERSRSQERG